MQTANTMTVEAFAGNVEDCTRCGAKKYAASTRNVQELPWYLDREYLRTRALTALGLDAPVITCGMRAYER